MSADDIPLPDRLILQEVRRERSSLREYANEVTNKTLPEDLARALRAIYPTYPMIMQAADELDQWRTWGVIEVMIRNPNVDSFVKEKEAQETHLRETAAVLARALASVLPLAGSFCFPQPGAATPAAIEDFNAATVVLAEAMKDGLLAEMAGATHTCERCGQNHYDHSRPTVPPCPFTPQLTGPVMAECADCPPADMPANERRCAGCPWRNAQ